VGLLFSTVSMELGNSFVTTNWQDGSMAKKYIHDTDDNKTSERRDAHDPALTFYMENIMNKPLFDRMPVALQVAILALVVVTAPIWGIPVIISALLDKDEDMNFDNGNSHKIDEYFEKIRHDMKEDSQ